MKRSIGALALAVAFAATARAEDEKLAAALELYDKGDPAAEAALVAVGKPDAVVAALLTRIRDRSGTAEARHPLACRVLGKLAVCRDRDDLGLPAILVALGHDSDACQEAAARAVSAIHERQAEWAGGRLGVLVRALLPVAWSQRGSLAEAGAKALTALTLETRSRDLAVWKAYLDRDGNALDIPAPRELVLGVEARGAGFLLNGQGVDRPALLAGLARLGDLAARAGVRAVFVTSDGAKGTSLAPLLDEARVHALREAGPGPFLAPVEAWFAPVTRDALEKPAQVLLAKLQRAVDDASDPDALLGELGDLVARFEHHPDEDFRARAAAYLARGKELEKRGERARTLRRTKESLVVHAILVERGPTGVSMAIIAWHGDDEPREKRTRYETPRGRIYAEGDEIMDREARKVIDLRIVKIEEGKVTFRFGPPGSVVEFVVELKGAQ